MLFILFMIFKNYYELKLKLLYGHFEQLFDAIIKVGGFKTFTLNRNLFLSNKT